jgi:uncharacterized protein (TIRG00374 family)
LVDRARSRWRLVVGVAVSVLFIAIALRGLKLDEFTRALRAAEYIWLVPAVAVYFLGVVARTWRWHYMLRHIRAVPLRRLFGIVCIGYMGNNIYPARAGEVLRSYVLKREYGVRMSASLATVVIERLFDGLTMLLFVFVALPFVELSGDPLGSYSGLIAGFTLAFLAGLVVFLWLAGRPSAARPLVERLTAVFVPAGYRARVSGAADRFLDGLASLRRGPEVLLIFATSVLIWLFETAKYWFVMHAFPFAVSFFTLMLMNGVVNLATTIPGLPAHIGTFDVPGIAVLVAAGVSRATATAYTVVLHVALWLPITVLGALYLWRSHISLAQARHDIAVAEDTPPNDQLAPA